MTWALLSTAFIQGLLGSTHCLGMCGPFTAILQTREGSGIFSNLSYNLGRTVSYASVGGVLGGLGWGVNRYFFTEFASLLGGLIIIFLGFGYIFPIFSKSFHIPTPNWIISWIGRSARNNHSSLFIPIALGLASGLMPCGLLFPAYGLALLSGDPWIGSLTMVSFSLGTYPMLLTLGVFGRKFLESIKNLRTRIIVGILLILFGLFTIWNRSYLEKDPNCNNESMYFILSPKYTIPV